jgi:single-stranded-DNA-specific exonuclease
MAKRWIIPPLSPDSTAVAERWGVPRFFAQVLVNRGLSAEESGRSFLTPQLKDLHPPQSLFGVSQATELVVSAIRRKPKQRIVLYGDYDVDGTTGVAILWHILAQADADVAFYVPHRVDEGYGLNLDAAKRLIDEGAAMIISVDCGITAIEVADAVRKRGVQLIVTDHHAPHAVLPQADAIVHPAIGGGYPNPFLCGAGVAFKLAWAIAQQLSGSKRVNPDSRALLLEMLPLAALGTIADVVPLLGENRIIARHGLEGLVKTTLPGLRALIESAGLGAGKISGYDVGFKLAPRINAAGRMGHARLAVELFTRADQARAREIAMYLEEHNRSRQAAERQILKQAVEMVERQNLASDARRAIVLASEGWHGGVIGIVAARLVDRYRRPTVMIALSEGEGQGSGRSIEHFDLNAALAACGEHLLTYGGHAMAAGLRIARDRLGPFTAAFVEVANNRLTGDDLVEKLRLDAEVGLDELTLPAVELIAGLGPFGVGNPRPRFATDWIEVAAEPRCVGQNQGHLQAEFRQNGVQMKAIGFGLAGRIEDLKQHRRCRVAFEPIINDYSGRRTVEMQMIDLRFPQR